MVDTRSWGPEFEFEQRTEQVDILLQRLDEALVENDLLKQELRYARSCNYLALWLQNTEIESLRRRLEYYMAACRCCEKTNRALRSMATEAHDHIVQLESRLKKRRKK